jgi:nocardicin N-oxygenase
MTELRAFPFPQGPDICVPPEHDEIRAAGEPMRVQLADGRTALVVADYHDVRTVLSDSRFSREAVDTGKAFFARTRESLALSGSDAPDHTRRRKAITHAFTPGSVARLTTRFEQLADELLDTMVAGGRQADLVTSFVLPFTMYPMCWTIGIPEEDSALLKPWIDMMMSVSRFSPEQVAGAHKQMGDYFSVLVAAKQRDLAAGKPSSDLLTDLLRDTGTEQGLSVKEIEVMGAGLLMAGFETISNHLAASAYLIIEHPSLADRLFQGTAELSSLIEELLRHLSLAGTGGHKHQATVDVPLSTTTVRAGELVVPLTEAANHDPAIFEAAHEFRPERSPNPHIAFGQGRHFCPGAGLARAELRIALQRLFTRLPELRLAVPAEQIEWRHDMYIGGPWALPVCWS